MVRIIGEEMGVDPVIRRLPMQPGDVRRTSADVRKAGRLLGYDPKWAFRDGIREFVKWFRR
jgi:UDP-glucuronate 4-epimerase